MVIKSLSKLTTCSNCKPNFNLFSTIIILFSIIIIDIIVYVTGGTSSIVHLMYIPIIISVFIFGINGGLIIAIIAGITVGPWMPLKVSESAFQQTGSWVLRVFMFINIVLVVGLLLEYIRNANDLEKKKAYEDIITGFPNSNKFKHDLCELINQHKQKSFSLIIYEFENLDMINRYVDQDTGQKSFIKLLNIADEFFSMGNIYTINSNKFVVVVPEYSYEEAYVIAKEFSQKTKKPIYIKDLPIAILIKGGIVFYPLHSIGINEIILKLDKALDQACRTQNDIVIYDNKLAEESEKHYNTIISLYHALQNNMFTLVYQPKINLHDNEIQGVETLLRWNDISNNNISISQLIGIAEDAGFISEITKWVIKNAISQLKKWQEEGIEIRIAINLSSRDLNDDLIVNYIRDCIKLYNVNPTFIEFELTERTLIEDEEKLLYLLNEIKGEGIKISLDDYGTGYNSLIYLVNLSFPFDYIKIDKLFIDNIANEQNKILIESIIGAVHGLGIEVIAEGVETEEQVNVLKRIGCDIIQGYYYSKPLSPEDLKTFVINFNK